TVGCFTIAFRKESSSNAQEVKEELMQAKQTPDLVQEEEHAIRQLVDTWLKASESGDVNTILTLMADDVIFMVPGREPFGKAEFAQNYKQVKGANLKTESDIQEIKVLGE